MDPLYVYTSPMSRLISVCDHIKNPDFIEPYERDQINQLLNDLSSLDYRAVQLADLQQTHRLLSSLTNIPLVEDTLIVKAFGLITSIVGKQKQSLHIGVLNRCLDWLLAFIQMHRSVGCCEALSTIQVLIRANTEALTELTSSQSIKLLIRLSRLLNNAPDLQHNSPHYDSCSAKDIQLAAANCLETCCSRFPTIEPFTLGNVLTSVLEVFASLQPEDYDAHIFCHLSVALLNICKHVAVSNRALTTRHVGDMLGAARSFMMYGLPNFTWTRPVRVNVSQQAVAEPEMLQNAKPGGKIAKTRKIRADRARSMRSASEVPKNDREFGSERLEFAAVSNKSFGQMTSESDFSESEMKSDRKDRHREAQLRYAALSLIGLIGQTLATRILFGYWHSLFPADQSNSAQTSDGLLNAAIRDPNPRCRIAALQAAIAILGESKPFLTRAENSDKAPTSYTPFSLALGDMVITMYRTLTHAINTESSLPVLVEVLKCLIVLIQATTFSRLRAGFIGPLVTFVRRLVHHRDPNIQVAALMVLQELIVCSDKSAEVAEYIGLQKSTVPQTASTNKPRTVGQDEEVIEMDEEEGYDSDNLQPTEDRSVQIDQIVTAPNETTPKMSWLLQVSLENLGVVVNPLKSLSSKVHSSTALCIESLHVISTMASNFRLVKDHLPLIMTAFESIVVASHSPSETPDSTSAPDIRLHAIRCIDMLGHHLNVHVSGEGVNVAEDLNAGYAFWERLVVILIEQLQSDDVSMAVRAAACEALSNIGVYTYERLPRVQQIKLVAALQVRASAGVEDALRGSAIRTLGIYVMFPSLRDNLCYIENTAEAITSSLIDGNHDVLVKSSWALGNLTNALLINSSDPNAESISDDLLKRLFDIALYCQNNDKVRTNAVRALGNLLRLIRESHLDDSWWQSTCLDTIKQLQVNCSSSGSMKNKWNACYAIGNLMHNPVLFTDKARPTEWLNIVIPPLCRLIVTHPNFKVRINAAAALAAVPLQRSVVDDHFVPIWKALLEALEQSDHMTDYAEYQHRDNLVDQLCITIANFICMLTLPDLPIIAELLERFDSMSAKWRRVVSRILPDRSAPLLNATRHLNELETPSAVDAQRSALMVIRKCFVPLIT